MTDLETVLPIILVLTLFVGSFVLIWQRETNDHELKMKQCACCIEKTK